MLDGFYSRWIPAWPGCYFDVMLGSDRVLQISGKDVLELKRRAGWQGRMESFHYDIIYIRDMLNCIYPMLFKIVVTLIYRCKLINIVFFGITIIDIIFYPLWLWDCVFLFCSSSISFFFSLTIRNFRDRNFRVVTDS